MSRRPDALGFFWEDKVVERVPKEVRKVTPPERTWESPDYLPGLEEALNFYPDMFTDDELYQAYLNKDTLEFDIECYPNYFLAAFKSKKYNKVTYVEMTYDQGLDIPKFKWILESFEIITFNGIGYDMVIAAMAIGGCTNAQLKEATNLIIQKQEEGIEKIRPYQVLKMYKVKALKGINHIDLMEVAPNFGSLKMRAGRMHAKRMQDLPFKHDMILTQNHIAIIRWYCINDLSHTELLRERLKQQMDLRVIMSSENGIDLRSKSDAQIAEAVIAQEIKRITGQQPKGVEVIAGTPYMYNPPPFMRFFTPTMQYVYNVICNTTFYVGESGRIGLPPHISDLTIPIGKATYQMGIGGLHSQEKKAIHKSDDEYLIIDRDVESYYPMLMLVLNLFPPHLGPVFLQVFKAIVDRRLAAKHRGDKVGAQSLKIVVNGTYGKLGEKHSIIYRPDGIIQVTLTGQLLLLMIIERLEYMGFEVVSANTDGIITKVKRSRYAEFEAMFKEWERETGLKTEETRYSAVYSRDVNSYIAFKEKGGYKAKGAYVNPWDPEAKIEDEQLGKNPSCSISRIAVRKFLEDGTPLIKTITASKDIRDFVHVVNVAGGGWKDGVYLGKAVRWYYAKGEKGNIVYADSGKQVGKSVGAKPCMFLPDEFPEDIDYDYYVENSTKMLKHIGYLQ